MSDFYKISFLDDETELGRFWVNKDAQAFPVDEGVSHGEWIDHKPELLNTQEQKWAKTYSGSTEHLINLLFANGWVRVSGFVIELYNEFGMPTVAKFLETHAKGLEDRSVVVIYTKTSKPRHMKIGEIIEKYGDKDDFSLVASRQRTMQALFSGEELDEWEPPKSDWILIKNNDERKWSAGILDIKKPDSHGCLQFSGFFYVSSGSEIGVSKSGKASPNCSYRYYYNQTHDYALYLSQYDGIYDIDLMKKLQKYLSDCLDSGSVTPMNIHSQSMHVKVTDL